LSDPAVVFGVVGSFAVEVGAVLIALRNVLAQRLTRLVDTKALFVVAHICLLAIFTLEFTRFFFYTSVEFMEFYTLTVVSLILWIGIALSSLAYIIFLRPPESTFKERLVGLVKRRLFPFGLVLILFGTYIAVVDAYLMSARPFTFVQIADAAGITSSVPLFDSTFRALVLSLFIIFLMFPSVQFVLAIRKIRDPLTRRAIIAIVAGWDLIAFDGLLIYGFLPSVGINAVGPGQLVAGIVLGITGLSIRRTSVFEKMFEPIEKQASSRGPPVINGGPRGGDNLWTNKGASLLEADPSVNYERAVKDFAAEMSSAGRLVFAFTSRGSPVYMLLHEVPGVRFFVLSDSSYPKPSGASLEVMVPRNDHSVLLNVMDEAVSRSPEKPKAIVFDNISSLILDSGFQDTYKFLRQANEILSRGNVVSVFLVLAKAHDEKVMNVIKNLYSAQLAYDSMGLRVTKHA